MACAPGSILSENPQSRTNSFQYINLENTILIMIIVSKEQSFIGLIKPTFSLHVNGTGNVFKYEILPFMKKRGSLLDSVSAFEARDVSHSASRFAASETL